MIEMIPQDITCRTVQAENHADRAGALVVETQRFQMIYTEIKPAMLFCSIAKSTRLLRMSFN
jgi:hypothetical protein